MWVIKKQLPVLGAVLTIPKIYVDVDQIRDDLTIKNPRYFRALASGIPAHKIPAEPNLRLFQEDKTTISVPRHYGVPWTTTNLKIKDIRNIGVGVIEKIEHKITLRDDVQKEACKSLLKGYRDKILALSCGRGKTVCALFSASEGNRFPLLIIVNTNVLMDQWRKEIEKWYVIDPSEIGHVQGGTKKWKGLPVVLGMINSVVIPDKYESEFYNYFKTIIIDESHHLGSEVLGRASFLFTGERWGLSATVKREDGQEKVVKLHLGEVVYECLEQPLSPKVFFVETGFKTEMGGFIRRGGQINTGKLYTHISDNEKRNELILSHIYEAAGHGRTILVLGERRNQLKDMYEASKERGVDSSLHLGQMKKEEREEALKHQVVFATQHLAKEGLDRPAFDTLVITIPFGGQGRLQQSIGRILRIHGGKKSPKVLVFVDDISVCRALSRKMKKSLSFMGFETINVGT